MELEKEYKVDKSDWRHGEWTNEPDRVEWRSQGFPCLIVRATPTGALCGYVGVPSTHSAYRKDYSGLDIEVHGGLTYANHCQENGGPICHIPLEGEEDAVWWLGFDCSHYGDYIPAAIMAQHSFSDGVYRNIDYVTAEVESLAEQLSKF